MKSKSRTTKKREKKEKPLAFLKFLKVIFWSVIFIFFGVIFLYLFGFPSLLKNVKTSENILFISDNLDGEINPIYIVHISSNDNENSLSIVDGNQKVEVAGGYGEYDLKSIYSLLKIDKKSDQYIKSVFSRTLNLPIDKITTTNEYLVEISKPSELQYLFAKTAASRLSNLDLSFTVPLKLHYLANTFSLESYDSLDHLEKDLYKLSTLDTDVYQYCSVAVVNTTTENGLARNISKLVENTGAMVIRTDGSDEELQKTSIFYSDEMIDCSRLVDNIIGIFPTKPDIQHISKLKNSDQYRSRVVIKIGSDSIE